jgi:hypothetical protein
VVQRLDGHDIEPVVLRVLRECLNAWAQDSWYRKWRYPRGIRYFPPLRAAHSWQAQDWFSIEAALWLSEEYRV